MAVWSCSQGLSERSEALSCWYDQEGKKEVGLFLVGRLSFGRGICCMGKLLASILSILRLYYVRVEEQ